MSKRLTKAVTAEFLKAMQQEMKAALKAKEFNFESADARDAAAVKVRKATNDIIDDLASGNLNQ